MKRLLAPAAAAMTVLIIGGAVAVAANKPKTDYTPQECAKLEREFRALQQRQRDPSLKAADKARDKARMGHIDDITNVFCN